LKPLARSSVSRAFSVSVCGESPPFTCGFAFAPAFAPRAAALAGGLVAASAAADDVPTGNSASSRVPSPSAITASAISSIESRFTSPSQ